MEHVKEITKIIFHSSNIIGKSLKIRKIKYVKIKKLAD
jgi:hypothetical protein